MAEWCDGGIHVIIREFRDYKSTLSVTFFNKTILNTLWAFKQKAYLDCILSLTKKKYEKLNVASKLLGDAKQP